METIEVRTEKTVFGGETIAKVNSKTVFIPFALPDETLSVNIVQQKNDYSKAQIIKILEPSPYRVKSECKYYGVCGGCNLMHASPDYQRELKKQMLINAFEKYKIDISDKIEIVKGPDYNYRARFQLNEGGLSQRSGNNVVQIKECLCAESPVNQFFAETPEEKRPSGRCHVFGSEKSVQKLTIEKNDDFSGKKVLNNRQVGNKSKKLKNIKENHYFSGTILSPENTVTAVLNGKNIEFDVRGFFQSNLFVFEKVVDLMIKLLPPGENVLDMYSGCGSLSVFLAERFANVVMVEHNRDAVVFAERNMNGKQHLSYGLSGENWVKNCASSCPAFDACVIDPPRSGAEKAVIQYLCKSKIPVILYISCNPTTQARDAKSLIEAGYSMERLFLLDFYPNTSHIESMALFIKS